MPHKYRDCSESQPKSQVAKAWILMFFLVSMYTKVLKGYSFKTHKMFHHILSLRFIVLSLRHQMKVLSLCRFQWLLHPPPPPVSVQFCFSLGRGFYIFTSKNTFKQPWWENYIWLATEADSFTN